MTKETRLKTVFIKTKVTIVDVNPLSIVAIYKSFVKCERLK
jgi:hypothetical protein